MYKTITTQNDEIYVTDVNEMLITNAVTEEDLMSILENHYTKQEIHDLLLGVMNGVTTPVNGFFTLAVDGNGNLYAYSAEEGTTPTFDYDEKTGDLFIVQERGEENGNS